MSNSITALCDKIIELDKKKTDQEWFATASTIETKVTGKYLAELYGGNEYEDGQFIAHTANHAAKLAKALKLSLDSLYKIMSGMTTDINRVEEYTKREAFQCKKEIEEIFK